jgi:hypothetical protein
MNILQILLNSDKYLNFSIFFFPKKKKEQVFWEFLRMVEIEKKLNL